VHSSSRNESIYAVREKEGAQLKWGWEHAFTWNAKKNKPILPLLDQYMQCVILSSHDEQYEDIKNTFASASPLHQNELLYIFKFPYQQHCDFGDYDAQALHRYANFSFFKERKKVLCVFMHVSK
jgi:hypothetical protein